MLVGQQKGHQKVLLQQFFWMARLTCSSEKWPVTSNSSSSSSCSCNKTLYYGLV